MAKINKPFSTKGINVTSPKGAAAWCKVVEPEYTYNAKGTLSTNLVCDPGEPTVVGFIAKLEALRDSAFAETKETLGAAKAKSIKTKDVYSEEFDRDGEPTGNIVFKFKLNNVEDREPPKDKIIVKGADRAVIADVPLVGNGSIIRCAAFANPYFMANTKEVGVSLLWSQMQILELISYGGGDEFDDEDGFTDTPKASTPKADDEDEVDF